MSYLKRAHLRIPTNFDVVIVTDEQKTYPAKINNMSLSGFQLLTKINLIKNSVFIVQFFAPSSKAYFDLQVKAVRIRSAAKSRSGFICASGVQIIDAPETWEPWVSLWIESRFEKITKRKIAATFLSLMGLVLAFKTATTAFGIQKLDLSISDFSGLESLGLPFMGPILIFSSLFLSALMLQCGTQTLRPSIRTRFFFTSSAAFLGVGFFSIRLLLKAPILVDSTGQSLIYYFDLAVLALGLTGAFMTRVLEDQYKQFKFIIERESISSLTPDDTPH